MSCSDVAEYLMQCVCSDQLNIQLKAVLTLKHLSAEVVMFQQYFQSCEGALKILHDIAAPPIVPQALALESPEVRTVRDATQGCIDAIRTPHTVEKQTEAAHLKERIKGFGNYQPPPEECTQKQGVSGQVAEFVGDSIGDMVDDFRDKGAVGALKDATVDALDLVLDGVDAIWGFVAGKGNDASRICTPQNQLPGGFAPQTGSAGFQRSPGAFMPPTQLQHPTSASNHYAGAFGGGVVGANHPMQYSGDSAGSAVASVPLAPATSLVVEPTPVPAPMVDLLSLDEPAAPEATDLICLDAGAGSGAPQPAAQDMLSF